MLALAAGHWDAALRFNALTPVALVMAATLFRPGPLRARVWRAGLALFAAYGICRVFYPGV
jgi:hypothetical protein